ncbi:MAG: PilW family protein, partial [bacterium]
MAGYPIHDHDPKGNGYSFVEMIIALAILGMTLLMVFGVMISQRKALKAEDRVIDMTRNTRVSLDVLL